MSFLVYITGQIEYIDIFASAGTSWHCKYEIVTGADWTVVSGLEAGVSQTANLVTNGDKIVLNFPLEVVYKSTNPYGWPQIVISVYRDMNLEGYGRIHIPIKAGLHERDISLLRPVPSSLLGYFCTFFGYQPELLQPSMLATAMGMIRMISSGEVRISLNVLTQGFQSLNYDIGI